MTSPERHYLVAGLGSIGQRHVRNLRTLRPEAPISVLRRSDSDTVPNCGWDREFTSLADALAAAPSGAILAGPASTHIELALAFANHGVPMLIEKPLSTELAGVEELRAACRKSDIPVSIGYNLRFQPLLKQAAEILRSEQLGTILRVHAEVGQYLPDWRPDRDYRTSVSARAALGGGVLLELSHEIDYVYWLMGLPDAVTCRTGQLSDLELDVEDSAAIILDYGRPHRIVTINLDFLQRPASRTCQFVCTAGSMKIDFIAGSIVTRPWTQATPIAHEVAAFDRNQMYIDEMAAFLDSVEAGRAPQVSLAEGCDVMLIIAAAKRSAQENRTVRISEVKPS